MRCHGFTVVLRYYFLSRQATTFQKSVLALTPAQWLQLPPKIAILIKNPAKPAVGAEGVSPLNFTFFSDENKSFFLGRASLSISPFRQDCQTSKLLKHFPSLGVQDSGFGFFKMATPGVPRFACLSCSLQIYGESCSFCRKCAPPKPFHIPVCSTVPGTTFPFHFVIWARQNCLAFRFPSGCLRNLSLESEKYLFVLTLDSRGWTTTVFEDARFLGRKQSKKTSESKSRWSAKDKSRQDLRQFWRKNR